MLKLISNLLLSIVLEQKMENNNIQKKNMQKLMSRETKQYIMLFILNCNHFHIKDIVKEIVKVLYFVSLLIVRSDFSY